jgi:signal transduction histidine kinase
VVTTAARTQAVGGQIAVDIWRYRKAALTDARALAQVIAENSAASVMFEDPENAREILSSLRMRFAVRRGCLYLEDGRLFASFERTPDLGCPAAVPQPSGLLITAASAPVTRDGRALGIVYVERDLADFWRRIAVAAGSGVAMLLLAGAVALGLAHRFTRSVSAPIVELASTVRRVSPDAPDVSVTAADAGLDEVGDLVRAFSDMLRRIQEANDALRRKETELEHLLVREREANRLKDEFLAAVSHELRTPLNAIMGWVQILSTTTASQDTVDRALASIARNTQAQTRVIEDLVDVSRIVTGKLTLRFAPVDLRDAVEGAVDVIRPAAQARHLSLHSTLPETSCCVNGDRDRLQQVIWNILANAVKFTEPGGSIAITLRSSDGEHEVEVTDTGIGIPAEFLPFVFDRFRQADGSMTREHGGLGLGLAIVRELTSLHGGTVDVRSDGTGRGSTVVVRVPALEAPHTHADGTREARS